MNYIALAIMCLVFIETFVALRVTSHINSIIDSSKNAYSKLQSKTCDDSEKEKAARDASLKIFLETGIFTCKIFVIILAVTAVYFAASALVGLKLDEFVASTTSVAAITATLILAPLYVKIRYV